MNNPFNVSEEKLKQLFRGYDAWIKSIPEKSAAPGEAKEEPKQLTEQLLDPDTPATLSDADLYEKVYSYIKSIDVTVKTGAAKEGLRDSLHDIRRNLNYLITSEDTPFMTAQNILEGEYRIEALPGAFWSPLFSARFPDKIPDWNKPAENFLKKLGIKLSPSKTSVSEKYKLLSDAFAFLASLSEGHDFHTLSHLMFYATATAEGTELVNKIRGIRPDDKILDIVSRFKERVRQEGLADELYKWQLLKKYRGRPDTSASDFNEEIRSIDLSNLVYHIAAAVKNHIASTHPEEYRKCFIQLFDEDEDLNTRVQGFMNNVLSVYRKVEPVLSSHHDERTASVFLTYHDPGNYALYKDSFYRKYCSLTGVSPKPSGEKYAHYMELISEFRDNYILTDKELISLVNDSLGPDCYPDESHLILAQNILYVMLDKDKSMANESELISVLKTAASRNYAEAYFSILENLADKFGFTNDNPRLAFSVTRSDNKLSVTVNQRPVISTDSGNDNIFGSSDIIWLLIPASRSDSLREHEHFIKLSGEDAYEKMPGETVAPSRAAFNIFSVIYDESILEAWYEAVKSELDHGTKSPFRKSHNSAFLDAVIDPDYRELLFKKAYGPDIPVMNLNTLLYGPPGTGKTYSTIDLAVRITSPEDYSPGNHQANRKVYEKLVRDGRIVFTTFHQSLSYEDFIEGIKPSADNSGNLTYSVEDGLFKRLAINAAFEYAGERHPEENKSTVIQKLLEQDIVDTEDRKKYVLIIDEINRGNVSQIFGELITLIEEDKRYGNEEGLSAILPYSKSKFFVTPNLYIIGTMNTADRSVEALDTALRRRFSFIEMTPQYDLDGMDNMISGYRISELLETLNQRIEKLVDRDHRIGHSYFLGLKNPSDLMSVFRNKIIPLLQEYFYGNYDKMGLVLGSGFIEKIADESVRFASYQADENDFAHKQVCRINKRSLKEIAEFEKALAALMNK